MKSMGKRGIAITVAALCLGLLLIAFLAYPTVFQRGNPFPYRIAAGMLSESEPYAKVADAETSSAYITKLGDGERFLKSVAKTKKWRFVEQGGSAYIFEEEDGERLIVASEVYWSQYLVWDVPK